MEVETDREVLTMPKLQSVAVSTTAEQSSHNQRRKRTSGGLVLLNGGANPEGSLASGSSAIEYQKNELGSECSCGSVLVLPFGPS